MQSVAVLKVCLNCLLQWMEPIASEDKLLDGSAVWAHDVCMDTTVWHFANIGDHQDQSTVEKTETEARQERRERFWYRVRDYRVRDCPL